MITVVTQFVGSNGVGLVDAPSVKAGDKIQSVQAVSPLPVFDFTGAFGKYAPTDGKLAQTGVNDFSAHLLMAVLTREED